LQSGDSLESNPDFAAIRQCLDGDSEAFRQLVVKHQDAVAAMMWRFTRDPQTQEELVQDVFVEAYLSLRNYKGRAPFSHYLSRIATRVGYRYWKRQARERKRQQINLTEVAEQVQRAQAAAESVEETLEPAEAGEIIYRLLDKLPPRDRLVLSLRYVEEKDVEETARLTGWSETMVKVQTWRARNKLKKLVESAGLKTGAKEKES
jgi:RNA polymerase sigma-70 factor (ECF subfamily)